VGAALLFRHQIDVMHHSAVMHLVLTLTQCNFLSQIWQPNIAPIAFDQSLLSALPRTTGPGARRAHYLCRVFAAL
jgi:hypothetical protein